MTDTYYKSKIPGLLALAEQHSKAIAQLEQSNIPGLRDFFATSALSILANANGFSHDTVVYNQKRIAEWAYKLADAMIEERNKPIDK